jgi:phospholipid/cholesterol/gamma-HCH transport system permease protein
LHSGTDVPWFASCIPSVALCNGNSTWSVERSAGGIRLAGHLRTVDAEAVVGRVRDATSGVKSVAIDLGGIDEIDGGVIALLRADLTARGVQVDLRGGDRFRSLIELYGDGSAAQAPEHRRMTESVLAEVGQGAVRDAATVEQALGFLGEMALAAGRLLRHPSRGHWKEIPPLVERAGADALPIVLVINFLLGFVIAYMSARELAMFGANIYIADLVGIAMARQLGPLMTAIIVSGRSGAAFATELGSMKVSNEIDALRTLGLEPMGWLVFPRVLTLVMVLPILTLLADLVGTVGGLLVAVTSLQLTPDTYLREVHGSLTAWDVESGLLMSVAFALATGIIACQQGFAAWGGPEGVGRRTTGTVVASLFAIVLIDASFTVVLRILGVS